MNCLKNFEGDCSKATSDLEFNQSHCLNHVHCDTVMSYGLCFGHKHKLVCIEARCDGVLPSRCFYYIVMWVDVRRPLVVSKYL